MFLECKSLLAFDNCCLDDVITAMESFKPSIYTTCLKLFIMALVSFEFVTYECRSNGSDDGYDIFRILNGMNVLSKS
jgi:hypothetical protein